MLGGRRSLFGEEPVTSTLGVSTDAHRLLSHPFDAAHGSGDTAMDEDRDPAALTVTSSGTKAAWPTTSRDHVAARLRQSWVYEELRAAAVHVQREIRRDTAYSTLDRAILEEDVQRKYSGDTSINAPYLPSEWRAVEVVQMLPLPPYIAQNLWDAEHGWPLDCTSFPYVLCVLKSKAVHIGVFPEISRIWLTQGATLYLWRYNVDE